MYTSSIIISNSNSLVLSSNTIVKYNYTDSCNLNVGTYNINFTNGLIQINSNYLITNNSYPILKNINGININPYIWYKFDTNSTQMLIDSSGNNFNLTNYNNASFDNINFIKIITFFTYNY